MKAMSVSEAKMKLSALIDDVSATDQEVLITKNGRPAAVLVSSSEFEDWKETRTIVSDEAFMKEIRTGIKALKAKKTKLYTLEQLFSSTKSTR